MVDRPNFFELLDLDPQQTSEPEIEVRLKEKKSVWAKESTMGSPKKRQEARRNLDLLPEIRRVLGDSALREQEAEDALRRRGAARQAQEKKLVEWIELLKGSGTCSAEQFGKICRQFEATFSEPEVRARFAAAGIRVEAGPAGPKPPRERTDAVTAKDIRQNLGLLGIASLYDLLGLPPSSSAESLRARAEEILKDIHRLGRTDSETAARSRLAGTCMMIFQSEEEKKKYDNHRLLEAVEAIEEQIKAAGTDGVLSAQEIETLIRLATQRGAPPDEVREVLEERAAREGWKVERAPAGPTPSPAPGASSQGSPTGEGEPPGPARLIVRPIPGGLRLSWELVRLPGIRYRVLRKAGSVPWDEGDGVLVAQTTDAQADDSEVPSAVPWYYAVFSLKEGLASSVPAHSGPHLVPAAGGAARSSRSPEASSFRRMAALGLILLLVLAGGAAALLWGPLAGLLSKARPTSVARKVIAQPAPPSLQPQQQITQQPTSPMTPAQPQVEASLGPALPIIVPPIPKTMGPNPQVQHINQSGMSSQSNGVAGDTAHTQSAPVPVPPSSPLPAHPEVAVVAVGDPLLASPLEDELEKALGSEGIGVVSGSPALDSLRKHRASSTSVSEILASLRADGVHAAVIAQVERGGERELSYYGRKDVSSSSRVKIFAYLVNGHRALSPGWSDQIEYTAITASTEGENAAHRAAGDLAKAVRNGWGTLRGPSQPTP